MVNETYAFIWHGRSPAIDETDWTPAWVADDGTAIIALMLSSSDCVDDLWVAARFRGRGLGSRLLEIGEREIRERGFGYAKLRVVAGNTMAAEFYARRGWTQGRQYPHQKLPIEMIDFEKPLFRT